jgi:hypothetical protein
MKECGLVHVDETEFLCPKSSLLKMPVLIDSGIAAIVARELIECAMFVISHVGAVIKNTSTSESDTLDCIRKVKKSCTPLLP